MGLNLYGGSVGVGRNKNLGANPVAYATTGADAGFYRLFAAEAVAYTFSGQDATLTVNTIDLDLGALTQSAVTPHQLPLLIPINTSVSANAYAEVEYRPVGGSYQPAHPLYKTSSSAPSGEAFIGTIFDLFPGVSYDVRVTVTEPGVTSDVLVGNFTTRALPVTPSTPDYTPSTISEFNTAIASAQPGELIELQIGTYSGGVNIPSGLTVDPANPIYIRGKDIDLTILTTNGGDAMLIDSGSVVIENLTVQGDGTGHDTGSDLGNRAFVIAQNTAAENVTIRDVKAVDVAMFVQTATNDYMDGILVYNCEALGDAAWNDANITTSTYWSDDGIRIPGIGNCVWSCTLQGFGDTITFVHSQDANDRVHDCYAYKNFIRNSVDDACEFDYRGYNVGAYDNYFENIKTGISTDDTQYGPVWIFRNIFVNVGISPIKPNGYNEGNLWYNNTILRMDSPDGTYSRQATRGKGLHDGNSNDQDRSAWRNNILIYRGNKASNDGPRAVWDSRHGVIAEYEMTNNAWYPDINIRWKDDAGTDLFTNLADAKANIASTSPVFGTVLGGPTQRHLNDVVTASDPFVTPITLPSPGAGDGEVTGQTIPTLAAGSAPKYAGYPIPGITDDYTGAAPDIGAIIEGRTVPTYGFVDPSAQTALQAAAAITTPNVLLKFNDDADGNGGPPRIWTSLNFSLQQLNATLYRDDNRKQIQFMGKAASTSQDINFEHWLYDEATNVWTQTTYSSFGTGQGNGHMWTHCFDPATGDYYFAINRADELWRRDGATGVWSQTSTFTDTNSSWASELVTGHGGCGWHPNLFGSGDGGFVLRVSKYLLGWRRLDDSWTQLDAFISSDPEWKCSNGGRGVYIPGTDEIVVGGGDGPNDEVGPLFKVGAGSGGAAGAVTRLGQPPQYVRGKTTFADQAHMINDPQNVDWIILVEAVPETLRVWRSKDQGSTFSLLSSHPYGGDCFTIGSSPELDAAWIVASGVRDSAPGDSYLWRPFPVS